MNARGLRRLAAIAVGASLPGGAVLAVLCALNLLAPGPALVAAAAIVVLTALAAAPVALPFSAVRDAIDAAATDPARNPATLRPRRLSPGSRALWLSVLRLWRAGEERGAEARQRLAAAEAAIAAVPDPLILIDGQRRIVRANAAAAELIGVVTEARDLAASLRNPTVLAAADAVLRGEGGRVVEFSLSVPVERTLSARLSRIDGPSLDGAVAILTLHDITGLKRAEQMRADFIANAGHELKTPLASLIGFIETLLGPAKDDAEARERFLGIMREQAGRMARLVDDLLSLSRIELNEHVAPTGRVALAPVVEHVAEALELRAADRDISVDVSLPSMLPEVFGDADELTQVFQNLLDNAIKYGRPHSRVTITAALADAGGDRRNGRFISVAVADQGDGIPGDQLPRLTERFYRVDTARSRQLGGTGLGLAIVKHILNRHRGRLDIASTLGVGSIFTVWLRAADGSGDRQESRD
jgi:two-component system phosphate regulon sensor histidine kinase PhoR